MTYLKDDCHDQLKPGDVIYANFRGKMGPFKIISDTGTGMFMVERPDGSVSPMRPSTILSVAR